jgi:hypothetical protein
MLVIFFVTFGIGGDLARNFLCLCSNSLGTFWRLMIFICSLGGWVILYTSSQEVVTNVFAGISVGRYTWVLRV